MAPDLADTYRRYIQAIRGADLEAINSFVDKDVVHNKTYLGLDQYKQLLKTNIISTKVQVEIKRLLATEDCVAAILVFTTSRDTEVLVGVKLNTEPFSYEENVFYDFKNGKIVEVHSQFDIDRIRANATARDSSG